MSAWTFVWIALFISAGSVGAEGRGGVFRLAALGQMSRLMTWPEAWARSRAAWLNRGQGAPWGLSLGNRRGGFAGGSKSMVLAGGMVRSSSAALTGGWGRQFDFGRKPVVFGGRSFHSV